METSPYKPFNIRTRDRLVGIFVIAGILLFLLGFLLPKLTELRQQELLFHTLLDETYGIVPGAKVSMRGLEIGQVEAVKLEANRIRIDFSLQSKYADFYRIGSVLNLNTNLAVSTLLTGTGLILIPGKGDLLNAGAAIPAQPPPELADVMDKLSDPSLLENIFAIVSNAKQITEGLVTQQQNVYDTLSNIKQTTENMAELSVQLPALIGSAQDSLSALESTLAALERQTTATDSNFQLVLRNTAIMTAKATDTLTEIQLLANSSAGVMQQLPLFIATTDETLHSITLLSRQLRGSWLFGSDGETASPPVPSRAYSSHPHEDGLYQIRPGPRR